MTEREELKALLMRAMDADPKADIWTLRWTPLSEHSVWDKLIDEVQRQMAWTRIRYAIEHHRNVAPEGWTP